MKERILQLRNFSAHGQYFRAGAISIEEGLLRIKASHNQRVFGVNVMFGGMRLQTYLCGGIKCVSCGRRGHYFAIEKCHHAQHKEKYHVNLWGIDKRGHHFLMTSDHIVPKSRGGTGEVSNRQPMCERCNSNKRDLLPGEVHYQNPKEIEHNIHQGILKLIREKLKKEMTNETII